MNEQIQERAKGAATQIALNTDKASAAMFGPRFMFEEYIDEQAAVIEKALTAQQTADAAAHREVVERLTKERDGWAHSSENWELMHAKAQEELTKAWDKYETLAKCIPSPLYPDDTAEDRARRTGAAYIELHQVFHKIEVESATARAESAKLREVLGKVTEAIRNMAEMPEYDQDDVWRLRDKAKKALALTLAATVLKEGEV